MDGDIQALDADAVRQSVEHDFLAERHVIDPDEEECAEEFERVSRARQGEQFRRVKHEARAIFGVVHGRPGVGTADKWAELLEQAEDDIGSGRFIVRCLGAERYLDSAEVAVLITLRQNLMAELVRPTAARIMMIDAAIIGYYNMLRTQRWIGNLSLVVERELFGQEPLSEIHGSMVGDRLEDQLGRLAEVMLPLQDRAARMMSPDKGRLGEAGRVLHRRAEGECRHRTDAATTAYCRQAP